MSLLPKVREKRCEKATVFEHFLGAPSIGYLERSHHRTYLKWDGSSELPIVDGHLLVWQENGSVLALCEGDLQLVVDHIGGR